MRKSDSVSLFDELIEKVTHDVQQHFKQPASLLQENVVAYVSGRTGCKAYTSAGRFKAALDLVPGLRKRYIGPTATKGATSQRDREERALREFLDSNERCRIYNEGYSPEQLNGFTQVVRGEVIDLLYKVLECGRVHDSIVRTNNDEWKVDSSEDEPNPTHYSVGTLHECGGSYLTMDLLASGLRAGPGSSAGVTGPGNPYLRACEQNMTFTSRTVATLYKKLAAVTFLGYRAEQIRQDLYGDSDLFDAIAIFLSVPKTNEKNRGICKQPSGNMHIQLAVHEILRFVLQRHFGIDLATQQFKNRLLARLGSRGVVHGRKRSWQFCTLDLSDASNFPQVLIQDHFPENWVRFLFGVRSPMMDIGADREPVTKHMMSTMGNGFTFSLMTLFLSSIVRSLYELANLPQHDVVQNGEIQTWAVYGDDIIVDKSVYNALVLVLTDFGFIVNKDKSFATGFFRESCGADYYDGYNVRPVFCEQLTTQADVFSLLNRLVDWGAYHSVELPETLKFLRQASEALGEKLRVPNWEDVSHGIRVPKRFCIHVPLSELPDRVRLSRDDGQPVTLDGNAYKALRPVNRVIRLLSERTNRVKYTDLSTRRLMHYNVTTYRPRKPRTSDPVALVEGRDYMGGLLNVAGFIQHMIGGTIREGTYSVRRDGDTVYEVQVLYTPGWNDARVLIDGNDLWSGSRGIPTRLLASYRRSVLLLWEEYIARNVWPRPS